MQREAAIRAHASALGFDACGFAAVVPLPRDAFLAGWLDAGCGAEMRYLERRAERRLTVAGILPTARTVVSLAYPYHPPAATTVDWRRELRGRVAAYALAEDYHDVIERKLETFQAFLRERFPGCESRRYVDTGAVLEREWAVRAGLGWFGKNTMLLSTQRGSWFFLAELITDLVLEPDTPRDDRCGRCTACLAGCPTGALREGLVLDARRCISYLTIEHRGAIPRHLRPALGEWIFGCDVCQEVCPWNDPGEADAARLTWQQPLLPEILTLDPDAFRARFGRTPLRRAKRRGLLRNAAVVLGNTGNPAAVPALARALEDPEPLVREHAAWALGAIGGLDARAALARRRGADPLPAVNTEIEQALGQ